PTSQVIADRLGISPAQAEQAVLRLQESGFLRKGEGDRLERTDQKIRFPTDRSFREVRDYQLAMLSKAQEELRTHMGEKHFQQRLISSVCLAGSTKKLNEARLILEEAMYRAANLMADEPMADEVYQINFQLFPLTRSDK
ncbi:MAG: DUF4423 domain-containing protein, partial [Bdellovibrionota bacterium]